MIGMGTARPASPRAGRSAFGKPLRPAMEPLVAARGFPARLSRIGGRVAGRLQARPTSEEPLSTPVMVTLARRDFLGLAQPAVDASRRYSSNDDRIWRRQNPMLTLLSSAAHLACVRDEAPVTPQSWFLNHPMSRSLKTFRNKR